MKKYINLKKNKNNMNNKLNLFILGFLFLIGGVFASPNLDYIQTSVWTDYNTEDLGNTLSDVIVASALNETISLTNASNNYTYNKKFEFPQFSNTIFLKIRPTRTDNMSIMWRGDLNSNDKNLYIQPFQVQNQPYIFKFTPSKSDDLLVVYLGFENELQIAEIEITEVQPKGFSYTIQLFMDSVKNIIEINITLWKIGFYLFILLVLTAFASAVLGLGLWIFDYIRVLKKKKKEAEDEKF